MPKSYTSLSEEETEYDGGCIRYYCYPVSVSKKYTYVAPSYKYSYYYYPYYGGYWC